MHSTITNSPQPELQNVVVTLEFISGDFEQGFQVALNVYNNNEKVHQDARNLVPPAPELANLYANWARSYDKLGHLNRRGFAPVDGQVTNHAELGQCIAAAQELREYITQWLSHDKFELLSQKIQANSYVKRDRSVPIAFSFFTRTPEANALLRKLPWHLWQLFTDLGTEVALSTGPEPRRNNSEKKVRILAVFGGEQEIDDTQSLPEGDEPKNPPGLNLTADMQALEEIVEPLGATVRFLIQPTTNELQECLRDKAGWDIFFFSGHSTTESDDSKTESGEGRLQINEEHSIPMSALKNEFNFALEKGLKLAIFNSCKGLGIANFFAGWSGKKNFPNMARPIVVVMKEAVPDFVARRFFRAFLEQFTEGQPIYHAVRKAREQLTILDKNETPYPCADWIPIVCLGPSQPELYWRIINPIPTGKWVKRATMLAAAGLAIWSGITLVKRFLGTGPESLPVEVISGDDYSVGEEFLLSEPRSAVAQAGVDSFRSGDYEEAIKHFLTALKTERNDPEQVIYLNNAQAAISGKPITRIAVSIPGTDAKDDAKELLRGVAQFQAENNCGIEPLAAAIENPLTLNCQGGKTALQVLITDHENRNDVPKILQRFERIADDFQVTGLIGRYNSDMTFAVEDKIIGDQIQLPTISTTSTAVREPDQAVSGYVFRTSPTDAATALKWNTYLESNDAERIAILHNPESVYSQSLRNELLNLMSDSVKAQSYDCDLSSINACLDDIQGRPVDAFVLIPSDNTDSINAALNFVGRYESRNEDRPLILGGDTLYSGGQILDRISQGSLLEQLLVAIPWHRSQSQTAFEKDASRLWGAEINWRTAMAYDAAKLLFNSSSIATCSAGTGADCRQDVRDAMVTNGLVAGATGPVSFSKDGNRIIEGSGELNVLVRVNFDDRTFECIEGEPCAN